MTTPPSTPSSSRRAWVAYAVAVIVMVAAWTFVRYFDQPYRSPTYRSALLQCLGVAAWYVPMEGAGPLTPVALYAIAGKHEYFAWFVPLFGAAVYVVFVAVMSRLGRTWDPLGHVLVGIAWLALGAIILTQMTRK